MRRRAGLMAGTAAVTVLTGALGACAPSKKAAESGSGGGAELRIATTTDVVNFNPLIGNSRTDYWLTNLMYPHLLTVGNDGSKRPSLATKWGYTNPTTGFYEIRGDMKWSDGTPLTASDVAYTLNAVKKDKPSGTLYGQLANFSSAKAVSPTRVELKLSKPDATVIPEVGFWGNVVPEHVFGKAGSVAKFANNANWVSAGPFRLTKVAKGQSYTLERVTPYPFAPGGRPTVSRIVYKVYPDVNTEILALKNGDVDAIANALPPAQVQPLKKAAGITVEEVPGLGYAHLAYNMDKKPLDNVKVRQALSHAVDYDAIRKVVLQGQAVSTGSSPIMPVLKQFHDPSLQEYTFDPAMARKLLQDAGYTADGSGKFPLSFRMIYSLQDPVTAQWATLVRDDAAKAGITIKPQGLERNTYLAKTDAGDYDIYAGNFAIMDDPATNMTLTYLPKGIINYSHVDASDLSTLVTKAQATTDVNEQKKLVQAAAKLVHDQVYDNVMYTQNLYVAHRSNWTGFVVKPSELLSIVDPQSLANVKSSS
ncbi:ABC transporter substrate-binding protein [Actinoallomurus iriomotensis]|uniref:Peptide ABC transporter substrate-binding protein n=1 Tax=Actinoallomurus iriomotensis TaxID=478107 RepID=A0A9W6RUX5_9ACTN|nr:ABC transporter substrate-binding protein [Actinoallomurus iriomotensis]GLY80607.1 peptide ABC transporter substrate-binding protein [Actinoallomurus iriomotensis]